MKELSEELRLIEESRIKGIKDYSVDEIDLYLENIIETSFDK